MARKKKEHLKRRKDGRFCCKWNGIPFYSYISEEDAFAKRDAHKASVEAGFSARSKVYEYALPWLERAYPDVADSTYHGLSIHLQHLIDSIGEKQISEVIPSDIKGIYSTHYRGLSASYINGAKQLYCALFDAAVADKLCRYNPARDKAAKPHRGTKPKEKVLTKQQRTWIETLCTDHRAWPVVMTMLYAGVRPQEAKAINIDEDVDFENNTITVKSTAHLNGSNSYEITDEMKTDWSKRQIPLFPPLKKALKDRHGYLIQSASGKQVTIQAFRSAWESYLYSMETAINGMPKRWYGKTKEHKKILADKGKLPVWIEFDIVPYTLRHAFCQMCRDADPQVDINTCRRWMGHADAKMIIKVYDSVSEDRSEQERKKVEKWLIGVQNGVQTENKTAETVDK